MKEECVQSDVLTHKAENIIPESLLAFSKDKRYLSDISSLISKCFTTSDDEEHQVVSHLSPEIHLLARIIFACYMANEKSSIGLSYMGLGYNVESSVLYLYGILFSFVPYFVERAGTNGWKDVNQVFRKFYCTDEANHIIEKDREKLKGQDRRKAFEESRKRMLEARGSKQSNVLIPNTLEIKTLDRPELTSRIQNLIWKVMQKMAMVDRSHPVAFESHVTHTDPTNRERPFNVASSSNLTNVFEWILRLHMALYYVSGKYPNLIHRISGLQVKKLSTNFDMVSQRPECKVIGLMIFTQLGAKIVKAFTKVLIKKYFQRSMRLQQSIQSIEKIVPCSNSLEMPSYSSKALNCGICMHTRKYPAAPIGCGHVFCWKCLQHFISTMRPECPLCRCSTSPQEIILLQNY